jgi:hypothetical protein
MVYSWSTVCTIDSSLNLKSDGDIVTMFMNVG